MQVRVPVPPRVRAVRADATDLRGQVEDQLGADVREQARGVVPAGQVVVGPARHERVLALRPEAVDQVRAEEAAAAGDEDPAHVFAGARFSQSTRPIQRSRFSAYQRIVRRTPSSQLTFGSQPVSRFSFS